ncbi:MAG: STELLO glycosyltransferase family protein, partial [Phycisphaerales bacterium]
NTWWWPQAYALLYLPSTCTFRMTDIWRSFIAQRCLWELGHGVVFHEPDVVQLRNMHNLVRDFADEVPGYLRNGELVRVLEDLRLESAAEMIGANLLRCYEALTANGFFTDAELPLVRAWLDDLARLGRTVGIGGSGRRAGDGATRA